MKVFFATTICVLFALSCKRKHVNINITNLNDDRISCFGHAGMGERSIYPANTFESFRSALKVGADGVEMDLQVTKDSVLVIYHDENLSSRTGQTGIIRNLNWNDIKHDKVNSILFHDLNLMSFDEFIEKIHNPTNYTYTFDCKLTDGDGDHATYERLFARTIVNTVNQYHLVNNVFIENPHIDFLNLVKHCNSELKLFLLAENYEADIIDAQNNGLFGISISNDDISKDEVKDAHSKNIRVTIYGVETHNENISAVEKQPDFIQTDGLTYLLKIFGKFHFNNKYFHDLFSNVGKDFNS